MVKILMLLSILLLTACNTNFKEAVGSSYRVLVSENVRANEYGEVGGRGAILYNSPLRSVNSSEHFYVQGRLMQEGSHITVVTHAVDQNFNGSVKVRLLREAGDATGLLIGFNGEDFYELAHFERLLNLEGEFFIRFELHNDRDEGLRFIFWSVKQQTLSKKWRTKKTFSLKNSDYDSLSSGEEFFQKGKGILWGATFHDAYIKAVINEAPYVY